MNISPGNIVQLRKKHPCGADEWQVIKIGADIQIRCLKCRRYVRLSREIFERRVRAVVSEDTFQSEGAEL